MGIQIFKDCRPFALECGIELPHIKVAYHTYGTLNDAKDNVVWVCHAMTANSDVADWWPCTVVDGGLLDPGQWFVVCANVLGSPYGSSSPLDSGWDKNIVVTFRDIVAAHRMLAAHLGIGKIARLIGSSTGGMQAMEWAYVEPARFASLVLIATLPRATAWITAFSEAQRMAIDASGNSPQGLAAARAITMLLYRGETPYNITQTEPNEEKLTDFKVSSYQRYQGKKLSDRFEVECYLSLLRTLDSHNIGRGRISVQNALACITTPAIVIGVDTDIMFPACAVSDMAAAMPQSEYHTIHSNFGHDGFLIEIAALTSLLQP